MSFLKLESQTKLTLDCEKTICTVEKKAAAEEKSAMERRTTLVDRESKQLKGRMEGLEPRPLAPAPRRAESIRPKASERPKRSLLSIDPEQDEFDFKL